MPDDNDILFARAALKEGYITIEGLSEAVRAQSAEAGEDGAEALDAILLRKGLIRPEDRDRLRAAIRKHRKSVDIKGFEVYELLGRGGMGSVFRARQLSLDRIVALKLLPKIAVEDRSDVRRFVREAKLAASLNHKHMVKVFVVGVVSDRYFISMEYILGRTLEDILDKEKAMPAARALTTARMISEALDHAHARGVVHRDLKPGNVMIPPGGGMKIVDFGLAAGYGNISAEKITRAGIILGTPEYISPEQARNPAEATPAADVYSLGAILHHMLSGMPPFAGENMLDVLGKVFRRDFVPLDRVREGLPPAVYDLALRMMAFDPADRPRSGAIAPEIDAVFEAYPNLQKERAKGMKDTHVISLDADFPADAPARPFALHGWQAVAVAAFLLSAFFFLIALATVVIVGSGGSEPQSGPAAGPVPQPPQGGAPTPEVRKDAEAMKLFREAEDFARKNPGRPREAILKFRRITDLYPGTMGAFKARDEIRKLDSGR